MKYAVLTIGKTHSGKTTFGRALRERLPDFVMIETDPIGEMLSDNVPQLRNDSIHDGKFDKPALKYRLFLMVLQEAIDLEKNIALTNSNMHAKGREDLQKQLQDAGYKVIFVYLDMPMSILEDRTASSTRSKTILQTVDTFGELLAIQSESRFVAPTGKEGDHFLRIDSPEEYAPVIKQIEDIVSA